MMKYGTFKYVTVSDDSKLWGTYISGAGRLQIPEGVHYPLIDDPPHHYFDYNKGRRLSHYQLIYITRGSGYFEAEGVSLRRIHSGEIFMLFPDVWHRFTPSKKTGWDEIWIEFNGELINQYLSNGFITPGDPVKKIGINKEILANLNQIIRLIEVEKPGWQFIASGLLAGILGMMVVSIKFQPFRGRGSIIEQKIREAKKILRENLHSPLKQEEIADITGMSYTSYRKSFKSITGISPKQYLINLRIDKAKEMLIMNNLSLREITDLLNIDSVYYFTQQFRQRTGFLPVEYRNKNRRTNKSVGSSSY